MSAMAETRFSVTSSLNVTRIPSASSSSRDSLSCPESPTFDATCDAVLSTLFDGLGELDPADLDCLLGELATADGQDASADAFSAASSAVSSCETNSAPGDSTDSASEAVQEVDDETGFEIVYRPMSPVGGQRCCYCGMTGFALPVLSDCFLSAAAVPGSGSSRRTAAADAVRPSAAHRLIDGPYSRHDATEDGLSCVVLRRHHANPDDDESATCYGGLSHDVKFMCAIVNPRVVSPYDATPIVPESSSSAVETTTDAVNFDVDDDVTSSDVDETPRPDSPPPPSPLLPLLDADDLAELAGIEAMDEADFDEDLVTGVDDESAAGETRLATVTSPLSSGYGTCSPTLSDEEMADEEIDIVSSWSPPRQQHQSLHQYDVTDTPEHNYSCTRLPPSVAPFRHSTSSNYFSYTSSSSSSLAYSSCVVEKTRRRGRPPMKMSSADSRNNYQQQQQRNRRHHRHHSNQSAATAGRSRHPAQTEHNFKERLRRVQLRDELHTLRSVIPNVRASKKRVSSDDILNSARDYIRSLTADSASLAAQLQRERLLHQTLSRRLVD